VPKWWADVSGRHTFSIKPTVVNSALICKRIDVAIEAGSMYITVVTGLAAKDTSSRCPALLIGNIPPGEYQIFYRGPNENPVPLGRINVES
jgi:hypothetical protein